MYIAADGSMLRTCFLLRQQRSAAFAGKAAQRAQLQWERKKKSRPLEMVMLTPQQQQEATAASFASHARDTAANKHKVQPRCSRTVLSHWLDSYD
jgi:hypothetical protein